MHPPDSVEHHSSSICSESEYHSQPHDASLSLAQDQSPPVTPPCEVRLSSGSGETIVIKLGAVIANHRGSRRRTVVLAAAVYNSNWDTNTRLVLKISCADPSHPSESVLVMRLRAVASGDARHAWALNHLPKIVSAQECSRLDLPNGLDAYLRHHGIDLSDVADDTTLYRLVLMERLESLWTIKEVDEYGQVFFDVLQVHRWVYEHPKVLHGDISDNNIMYRRGPDGEIFGVLNDFDLSIDLECAPAFSSGTGTRPFIARELLSKRPHPHRYRHDMESLFCVMLLLFCGHRLVYHEGLTELSNSPFEEWYGQNDIALHNTKYCFLQNFDPSEFVIEPVGEFAVFQDMLTEMRKTFALGMLAYESHLADILLKRVPADTKFDKETLGGEVTYQHCVDIMSVVGPRALKRRYL